MCKFLLDNGLDAGHTDSQLGTVFEVGSFYRRCPDPKIQPYVDECRNLLLDAGADPLHDRGDGFSHFESLMGNNCGLVGGLSFCFAPGAENHVVLILVQELAKLIKRMALTGFGPLSAILKYRDTHGSSLIHMACHNSYPGSMTGTIAEIMRLGFDINSTDCAAGLTPLAYFLRCCGTLPYTPKYSDPTDSDPSWVLKEQDIIVFLLRNGSDIYQASDIAYTDCTYRSRIDLGCYRQDLWDSSLALCGYDIRNFRFGQRSRRANYSQYYTRDHFEQLWWGREHLCPYWDDSPWSALDIWASGRSDGVAHKLESGRSEEDVGKFGSGEERDLDDDGDESDERDNGSDCNEHSGSESQRDRGK